MEQQLRDNVRKITTWLGQIIREKEGEAFFKKVEQVRLLCKELRQTQSVGKTGKLKKILLGLSFADAHRMARAFTLYFQLVNLVEENHRIKKIQSYDDDPAHPGPMSLQKLFKDLSGHRVSPARLKAVLEELHIEPVLTAHPTEAKRKTVVKHLANLRMYFEKLDERKLSWREQANIEEKILETLEMLWQTKHVRDRKLSVEDEIEYIVRFFRQSIFSATHDFRDSLTRSLELFYPTVGAPSTVLTFGSWVGGDRDGNPMVTPQTSEFALKKHRAIVLHYYRRELDRLFSLLTSATRFEKVDKALEASVMQDIKQFPRLKKIMDRSERGEYYRLKLRSMWTRLQNTQSGLGPGYESADEFISDLETLKSSLVSHHGPRVARGSIQALIDQARVFQFHLARLDFRQHSAKIRAAVEDLLGRWPSLDEWPELIQNPPVKIRVLSKTTRQILSEFKTQLKLQEDYGRLSSDHVIISMTHEPDDMWAFLFLARKVGLLTKNKKKKKEIGIYGSMWCLCLKQ